ncbi:alkaline phosphatase [Rubrivirga sp. IMCC43871]|uniref:alkaline phosphatase n=1 Tax=Rubrivirga sp. IMCC43871 TaxID=3391575 RepID=UPI00398FCB29
MLRRLPILLLALALGACTAASTAQAPAPSPVPHAPAPPKNVILMIADGFGPASATLGAAAKGAPLAFDSLMVGAVETSASDSRVTDSAASATAYACGIKTYNGAIGMTADRQPCRTVLELASATGRATGLVATSRITHATPASFGAHVERRAQEVEIARQLAVSDVDLLVGGGRSYFTDDAAGAETGARLAPLVDQMRDRGWAVATDRVGFDAITALPAAAFLADSHLAYEIDRDATDQPSLAEMTTRALDLLAASPAGQERGFFVMIEGSRIDHAGHGNDPAAHLGDVLAYDAAVEAALAWAAADGATLVVSTADHETGGMTLGRDGIYKWDPAPLLAATASFEAMTARLVDGGAPAAVVQEGLGLDALPDGVEEAIRAAIASGDPYALGPVIRDIASEPAGIGWTTGGHTAVDVGLYAWGPGAERFAGRMPNDAVGRALMSLFREGTLR